MKKIFSNYYKIILSVVILIVLVALKEDYKTSFRCGKDRTFFRPNQIPARHSLAGGYSSSS